MLRNVTGEFVGPGCSLLFLGSEALQWSANGSSFSSEDGRRPKRVCYVQGRRGSGSGVKWSGVKE